MSRYLSKPTGRRVAVLVTGELRGAKALPLLKTFVSEVRGEVYLSTGQCVQAEANRGCGQQPAASLDAMIAALRPVWLEVANVDVIPAMTAACTPGPATCVSRDDRRRPHYLLGCYQGTCETCDTRKYWKQFSRLASAYSTARRHGRYEWFARVRTDGRGLPRVAPLLVGLNSTMVYFAEDVALVGTDPGDPAARLYKDYFFVAHRSVSDAVFSVGSAFLRCQRRDANEALCGNTWAWASPECVLKNHLAACLPRGLKDVGILPSSSERRLLRRVLCRAGYWRDAGALAAYPKCWGRRNGHHDLYRPYFQVNSTRCTATPALWVPPMGCGFSDRLTVPGGASAVLLVGDSVDRKIWETANNSDVGVHLARGNICLASTAWLLPELAVAWLSDPTIVKALAPVAAAGLAAAWRRGCFKRETSFSFDEEELNKHTETIAGLKAMGFVEPSPNAARPAGCDASAATASRVIRALGPCHVLESPTAIVVHANYHVLWAYHHASDQKPNITYRHNNQRLPDDVVDRFVINIEAYMAALVNVFPSATMVLRTAHHLDPHELRAKADWAYTESLGTYIDQLNDALRTLVERHNRTWSLWDVGAMFAPLRPQLYTEPDHVHLHPSACREALRALMSYLFGRELLDFSLPR